MAGAFVGTLACWGCVFVKVTILHNLNCVAGAFVGTFACRGCVFVKVTILHNLKLKFLKILLQFFSFYWLKMT